MKEYNPPAQNDTINHTGFIFDVSKKSYTVIDNWLFDTDLTEHEKLVYIVLKRFAIEPNRIFPSHNTIAKAAAISKRTVIRAIEGLVKKKLIIVRSQKSIGRSNVYLLCDISQVQEAFKIGFLKLIEGMPESHRGMPESHRGMPESHRGMPESHTSITSINTIKTTHTTALLCFSCKKDFSEPKFQLDFENKEYESCPYCLSKLILNLSKIPLSKKTVLQILKSHEPDKVFLAIDLIRFQYRNTTEVKNYQRLLLGLLRKDIIMPDDYVPFHERRTEEIKKKRKEKEKEDTKLKGKAEEKAYFEEAERRYNSLMKEERDKLEKKVKESLPPILRSIKGAVKAKVFEILMEDRVKDR